LFIADRFPKAAFLSPEKIGNLFEMADTATGFFTASNCVSTNEKAFEKQVFALFRMF
jgi:hypothetical protein